MYYLVIYDISDDRLRTKVADICLDYGSYRGNPFPRAQKAPRPVWPANSAASATTGFDPRPGICRLPLVGEPTE